MSAPLMSPDDQGMPLGVLEVDRDALLVAVQVHEIRRLVVVKRRAPGAGDVSGTWRLDFDHLAPKSASIVEPNGRRARERDRRP